MLWAELEKTLMLAEAEQIKATMTQSERDALTWVQYRRKRLSQD